MKIILDYNRTLFDPDADTLYPGVLSLLSRLSERNELFLVSRNEPIRRKRMKEFALEDFFKEIMFVDEKSKQVFKEIVGNSGNVIVVGDRISDEIQIGNQLDCITVRLKQGKFAMEIPQDADEIATFEIQDIRELEKIISSYEN